MKKGRYATCVRRVCNGKDFTIGINQMTTCLCCDGGGVIHAGDRNYGGSPAIARCTPRAIAPLTLKRLLRS